MGKRTILDLDEDVRNKLLELNKAYLYLLKKLISNYGTSFDLHPAVRAVCKNEGFPKKKNPHRRTFVHEDSFIKKLAKIGILEIGLLISKIIIPEEDIYLVVPRTTPRERVRILFDQYLILFIRILGRPSLELLTEKLNKIKAVSSQTVSKHIRELAEEGVPEAVEWLKKIG